MERTNLNFYQGLGSRISCCMLGIQNFIRLEIRDYMNAWNPGLYVGYRSRINGMLGIRNYMNAWNPGLYECLESGIICRLVIWDYMNAWEPGL